MTTPPSYQYYGQGYIRLTTIQSPLSTIDVPHYWQCVYGPHPHLIILAEHAGVSMEDFSVLNEFPQLQGINTEWPLYRKLLLLYLSRSCWYNYILKDTSR